MALLQSEALRGKVGLRERELEQEIAGRKGALPGQIEAAGKEAERLSQQFGGDIEKITASVAARYGLDQSSVQSAVVTTLDKADDLKREREETLAGVKFGAGRDVTNKRYNFALNRFLEAGFDRSTAEQYARQVSLDVEQQKAESARAAKGRTETLKREEILAEYSKRKAKIEADYIEQQKRQAMKNAIINSLFGLGTTIATGAVLGAFKAPAAAGVAATKVAPATKATPVASQFGGSERT